MPPCLDPIFSSHLLTTSSSSMVLMSFSFSWHVIVIVIALCLQYVLKGYPRKFLELLTGTPPHLTLNQVSYHSAESTEEIA